MRSRPTVLAALAGLTLSAAGVGLAVTGSAAAAPVPRTTAAAAPAWTTVFRDDFSGSGLPDPAKWLLTLGTSYPGGPAAFGTGEIETLTNDQRNVQVRNGALYITPQRDAAGAWTSARVETARSDLKPPDNGVMRVESRLQMPNVTGAAAKGYWPAFWMLGGPYRADRWSWPAIGEFDIMENVQGLNWTYNVLHCGTWGGPCNEPEGINNGVNNAGTPCLVTTCQAGFHTYGLEWDRTGPADQLRWYLDGTLTFTVNENQVPAQTWASLSEHAGYFIILNVAIGGAFPNKLGGGPTAATTPGVPMIVDYVDVKYAAGTGPTSTVPTAPSGTTTPTTNQTPTTPTGSTSTGSTSSNPIPSTPVTGAPSDLRVGGTTASTITLNWDGPAGATYEVLRSDQRIATVTGNRFTDIGLLPNTPYLYSVRGAGVTTPVITVRIGLTSPTTSPSTTVPTTPAPTTAVSTSTPPPTTPSPNAAVPTNLRVTGTTGSTVTLGWDGAATSYDVLRSGIKIATVTSRTFTDVGLFPNTPYLYSVRSAGGTTPVLTAVIR